MGTVSSSGIGSGIDIESLVTKLVAAEGAAKKQALQVQGTTVQAQISAYGKLKSSLATLQTAAATLKDPAVFRSRSASVADATVLGATASSTAAPGTYNVEVVRLAKGAKLSSGPLAGPTTAVGTGTLTLTTGGNTFAVEIASTNNTLAGIRDAINAAKDNTGVAATIVTANDGARLVLTSTKTGVASAIKVTQSGGDGGLAQLVYDPGNGVTNLTSLQAAQDARVIVDGFTFDSASNSVTGALDGVTFDLKNTTATGVTTAVTVNIENSKAAGAVSGFVTAYNQVVGSLRAMGAYDSATKTGGVLLGDSLLRGALGGLRSLLGSASDGLQGNAFTALVDIGVTTNLDGTLKADTAKINAAVAKDSAAFQRLFTDPAGFGTRLDALVQTYTKSGGLIDSRTGGLETTLKDLGSRATALDESLAAYETRIRAQFTAMDSLVAQLKQTGANLVSSLGSIDYNYFGSRSG